MYCNSCGRLIVNDSIFCPACGARVLGEKNFFKSMIMLKTKYKVIITICFAVLAIICIIIGISCIMSEKYDFYIDHYNSCLKGYRDCKFASIGSESLFSPTYEMMAEEYKELMDNAQKELWIIRIKAISCFVFALIFAIFSYLSFYLSRPYKILSLNKHKVNYDNNIDNSQINNLDGIDMEYINSVIFDKEE